MLSWLRLLLTNWFHLYNENLLWISVQMECSFREIRFKWRLLSASGRLIKICFISQTGLQSKWCGNGISTVTNSFASRIRNNHILNTLAARHISALLRSCLNARFQWTWTIRHICRAEVVAALLLCMSTTDFIAHFYELFKFYARANGEFGCYHLKIIFIARVVA